jgi:hypothetical protein
LNLRRLAHTAATLSVALIICGLAGAQARASQTATISARFNPYRLGAASAVGLGFDIRASGGGVPSPLTGVELRFPINLGLATSGLGVASCEVSVLEATGPAGCPANSKMGSGSAQVRFQIGPEIFTESATLGLVAGPSQDGFIRLLVSATGETPVAARIVMSTLLLPGRLKLTVPLVPSLPEGPFVSVVHVQAILGGKLTYYEQVHGRALAYRPRGIGLPRTCPRSGFKFAATFSFRDGSHAFAQIAIRCPRRTGR